MAKELPPGELIDNFNFVLVGAGSKFPFKSYISSIDPTNAEPGTLIAGSQNTFVNLRGNPAVRPGLKRRGVPDATLAGTKSSYEWEASTGITHPLRVNNGNLEVEVQTAIGLIWVNLMTALTLTRFVFVPWWNDTLKKDQLLFVKGDTVVHEWSGGVGLVAAVSNAAGFISAIEQPYGTLGDDSGGTGYVVGDVLTVTGGIATVHVDAVSPGGIVAVDIISGGMGYSVGDIITLALPTNGAQAQLKVLTAPGNIVGSVQVISAGSGYVANPNTHITNTTGGGGTGFTVSVATIGNTITAWHVQTNAPGYSGSTVLVPLTGGTGTGASLFIQTVGTGAITLEGSESIAQLGFEGVVGNVVINGIQYSYIVSNQSGGQSFVGISPDPTALGLAHIGIVDSYNGNFIGDVAIDSAGSDPSGIGQSFTASQAAILTKATFSVSNSLGADSGIVVAKLYSVTGTYGSTSTPLSLLATSDPVNISTFSNTGTDALTDFPFSGVNQFTLVAGTQYFITLELVGSGAFNIGEAVGGASGNVATFKSGVWTSQGPGDLIFYVYGGGQEVQAGDVAVQQVVTQNNLPDPTNLQFTNDFCQVINNQFHVGCYQSRFVYVSSDTNYADFSVPDVRSQGDPDLLTLDSNVRGIAVQPTTNAQEQNAVISGGLGDWYTIVRSQITVGTTLQEQVTVTKSESADLATALAHEFIDNIGGDIIFLDQNNQLREFGTVRNINNPVFPLLSLDVYTELQGLNFTGGHVRAVASENGETVYITCPLSGVDYMYQIRQQIDATGNLTAQRIWQPPQVRGLSRIALIDGITYGHSNSQPQLYQLWETEQYHDDSPAGQPLPYECHALMAYLNGGRFVLVKFDKLAAEGYMTQGSVVTCNILLEYEGSLNTPSVVLNNPVKGQKIARFYVSANDASLGENSLGSNPLGDGLDPAGGDAALLPKFRTIRDVTPQDVFEYALDVMSNTADSQWELESIGVNQIPSENRPVNLRKST